MLEPDSNDVDQGVSYAEIGDTKKDPEVSSQDTPVGYDNPGLANPPAPVPATQYETVTVDKVIYASEALDPLLVGPFQDTNFLIWFKVMAALVVTVVLASFSAGLVYHFAG